MKRRIFISTGEVSGDLQGATLVTALFEQAKVQGIELEILALGGARMQQAGATLLGDTRAISSIGLVEAIPQILPTLKLQRQAQAVLKAHPPDLVILIDYIGANLKIGRFVRQQFPDIPIVYYIAPQEWVWSLNDKNTNQIAAITDRVLAIFPEEAAYYQRFGIDAKFIGHPLIDQLRHLPDRQAARQQLGIPPEQVALLLSPASRTQELKYLLPEIFAAAQTVQSQIPQVHFWIPLALPQFRPAIEAAIAKYQLNANIIPGDQGRIAIAAADLAITKSGTINLEMALLNVPQVVTYRLSAFTAWVGYKLLKLTIPFASPVNLVLMREVVPELLQDNMKADAIAAKVLETIQPQNRERILADYQAIRDEFGEFGVCDRAANIILEMLNPNAKSRPTADSVPN
ncbi:lipid-A-disaccharide synthase [filamentous cyanobacterium LEGE 11480]|uniref:Lipid-A-disaccharide synthase n=1 Tax=Romeriopsis navalis LEGE 11480 TaxID=2777977 RepID=A0A928VSH2_9CYAN|nr:lipid-A-disaccharide synthase [Romeriopsis navalis]MBE9032171.1 lipid-A-disaccharide synthase [Romeriopsis navalis LEGE 11480]